MRTYDKDSSANAVVLKEFGRTHATDNSRLSLVHFYHVRIKILNDQGINQATFAIPIFMSRDGSTKGSVSNIKAATFISVNEPSYLDLKNIFTETQTPYSDLIKFTLPNAKSGSVIEVQYTLSSPYIYNFREWAFQSDIPKIYSEYWAEIPAILTYHITFSGFQKRSEGRKEIEKNFLVLNGGTSDCALIKFGMKDIPAFREEKFMTAKKNFLSAVHVSLSAVHDFDGSTKNLSQKWDDVADQLRSGKDFGVQIKRGKSLFTKVLDTLFSAGDDRVLKAKKIYEFVRNCRRIGEVD